MKSIIGVFKWPDEIAWSHLHSGEECEFAVSVRFGQEWVDREALTSIAISSRKHGYTWLVPGRNHWTIDVPAMRSAFPNPSFWQDLGWLDGMVSVRPEVRHEFLKEIPKDADTPFETWVSFYIPKEDFILDKSSKIFLSHKGADKPLVRRFFDALKLLGFDPWLDEDAMPAGTELHRGIRQGFKDSCGAVFFLTPRFQDEAHLRNEINYAIEEKTTRGNRFSIVTLEFDEPGCNIEIPDLLRPYVWKHPKSELEGLGEIIRALPIQVGPVNWRSV